MFDWSARIDDLAALLAQEYSMEDRAALEVLLSALVPCPRTPSLWLILETNWYSRVCEAAWFAFGGQWTPHSLAQIRARQPWRPVVAQLTEWLDAPSEERLFVEPDFERYPRYDKLPNALFVADRSLRVRAVSARVAHPLRGLDAREQERREDSLSAATRAVLEDRIGARSTDPPVFRQPPNFAYHVELVERLAPWFRDWQTLLKNFAALAVRRAYLYGRTETTSEDWAILSRVARDSAPPWIAAALRLIAAGPHKPATIERAMRLFEATRRSGHGAQAELARLRQRGLLHWDTHRMHWKIAEEHAQGVAEVIEGRAFGANVSRVAA